MPLIACPDCRREISDAAPACPHCGRPALQQTQSAESAPTSPEIAAQSQSTNSETNRKNLWLLILPVLIIPWLWHVKQDNKKSVQECVTRGVIYFKTIGSYPTLSSYPDAGRKAEDVAADRCGRSTRAFPGQ